MGIDLKKVLVAYNPSIERADSLAKNIALSFSNSCCLPVDEIFKRDIKDISLMISVGGDGTLLRSANYCAPYGIKILGFNMGRLGYLAQAKSDDIEYVAECIKNRNYRVEERVMLKTNIEGNRLIALNDMVIKGAVFSRTSTLNLYINDILVSNYLADGLIISTSTGSTAYNLSAGGPVVAPSIDAFIVVPICPHTLSARPLVIPTTETIKIKMPDYNKFNITSDGQITMEVKKEVVISKYEKSAKLILLNKNDDDFYNVLREKLHWGLKIDK